LASWRVLPAAVLSHFDNEMEAMDGCTGDGQWRPGQRICHALAREGANVAVMYAKSRDQAERFAGE
jgi:hypothetical protein